MKRSPLVPDTSTTLLKDVGSSSGHVRWAVFHARYEPMMRAFLRTRFPAVDADDIIQETFVALMRALPKYVYNPQETGHFHNYLTGILRNKALRAVVAQDRERLLREKAAETQLSEEPSSEENDLRAWREAVYEIALQQLLADESIHERTKQVFVRLAIDGEKPEAVAASLDIPYNTVIKTKERMLARLRTFVEAMKTV